MRETTKKIDINRNRAKGKHKSGKKNKRPQMVEIK